MPETNKTRPSSSKARTHRINHTLVSFTSGAAYGFTSVVVGQPFDTVKTRVQTFTTTSPLRVFTQLFQKEGIRGLYRGGIPIFIGGSLFRSAQFGFYDGALSFLRETFPPPPGSSDASLTALDWRIVLAGFWGGIGRGIVEGPFEYVKVRRQVQEPWRLSRMYEGSGVTIFRNAFLFCSFSIYRAVLPPLLAPLSSSSASSAPRLPPFVEGALCANLAWLTVWPLDVVKSQAQSGKFRREDGLRPLLRAAFASREGAFRGLVPGLVRSTFANGCAMVVYRETERIMSQSPIAVVS